MAYNLVDKAILQSSIVFQKSNINTVKDILRKNYYPANFVKKHIEIRLKRLTNPKNTFIKNKNPFVVMPYNNALLSASLNKFFNL